ncbi:MAG TPA: ATP-binding cassette domain-containing protein [Mycobacteriales bacterium]|nr:ATP-binding cassette domain-containing protein [Mycobacteriales bacterium]
MSSLAVDAPADPLLSLAAVRVERGDATLLRDVDWTVRAGQRWVVLGPNGAGKTTLLEVAAAATSATSGRVSLFGEAVADADLDLLLPKVGWCSPALGSRLPGAELVVDTVMSAAYAGVARGDEPYDAVDDGRARALLALLGCRGFAERRYGSLSAGEQQRVQIARALMPDPELMLLDEPAAGLDLAGREALLRWLTRLALDPAAPALVLVTHHVEDIPVGMSHALLLRAGSVVAAGPIEHVLTGPALSACFGLPLDVEHSAGRYAARASLAPVGGSEALR